MPRVKFPRMVTGTNRSSALVIVLFFIVLLTALTIAFLSRSLTALKVSSSSTGETKSKLLASSASDIIIGDFKQEIIAGSTLTNTSSTATNWSVYIPNSTTTMIPQTNGIPTSGTLIPNMISRSVRPTETGGSCPYVAYSSSLYTSTQIPPNRTADDTSAASSSTNSLVSTTKPSLNGRYISPSQWNAHYLIPRNTAVDTAGSTNSDSTPTPSFAPPDWVIVTRGGANSVTWSSGTGGLNDPTLTNTNYVVGRYAYAVYNEGGLLDMNAAGYPGDTNVATSASPPFYTGSSSGLTPTQVSQKGSMALADLTQLSAGGTSMTQAQINQIVGWRNYASANLGSSSQSYGNVSFTTTTASNWMTNFVTGNTNGFMKVVSPAGVTTPPTDQSFLSRQQLISMTQSLAISPDFLQYLGTFSRALEQPSFVPDPSRPKVLSNGLSVPTAGGSPDESTYIGNNDGQGGDIDPNGINPSFLNVRWTGSTATLRTNGSTAITGEPLVKTKFPLSRLAWITYKGPSALRTAVKNNTASASSSPSSADYDIYLLEYKYGYSNAYLLQGTAANVLASFGLTYSSTSTWTYNHGQNAIYRLYIASGTSVQSLGRDPDFAELLKAAITTGSLAKGGPNLLTGGNNYQYTLDTSTDLNILQIMANLIDQFDADSYPTVIQIQVVPSVGSPYYRYVYGVEDMPYFYRYHLLSVVDTLPSTNLSNSDTVTFPMGTGTTATTSTGLDYTNQSATAATGTWNVATDATATASVSHMKLGTVSGSAAGEATLFLVPDLWNPHDQNTLASETSNLRPTQFRLYALTDDPASQSTACYLGAIVQPSGSGYFPNPPQSSYTSDPYTNVLGKFNTGTNKNIINWPISVPQQFSAPAANVNTVANNIMYFGDNSGTLFREPTLLWNTNPTGIGLTTSTSPHVTDANTSNTYYGIIAGKAPLQMQATFANTPSTPYIIQGTSMDLLVYKPTGAYPQISFVLQYLDPTSNNWITYDAKYFDFNGHGTPNLVVNTASDYASKYQNVLKTGQFQAQGSCMDPRTARWGLTNGGFIGMVTTAVAAYQSGTGVSSTSYLLEPSANTSYNSTTLNPFSVLETDRARGDKGNLMLYGNPASTNSATGKNAQMHWFSGATYFGSSGDSNASAAPLEFIGLFSQNDPAINFNSRSSSSPTANQHNYYEDADGMVRKAMGAYAVTTDTDSSSSSLYQASDSNRLGLPEATASTLTDTTAVATATAQTQSRPMILNRPFRSVSEMSYAFSGTPWKNIDFFTPASGDSALLDTFCLNEVPTNGLVAGKVDLNTRQTPVLQAIVAGAYRDEFNNVTSPPSYALPPISGTEASSVATTLQAITSDTTHAWRGPLKNISALVGHYVSTTPVTSDTDFYTYAPATWGATADTTHGQQSSMTYAGLSAALDCTSFNGAANHVYSNTTNSASTSAPIIQRFREAAIRPLADAGQVRVWNLLIDLVAQTGRYPKTATGIDQFVVDGQTHVWVHVALDRYTGQVLDKQIEVVTP